VLVGVSVGVVVGTGVAVGGGVGVPRNVSTTARHPPG